MQTIIARIRQFMCQEFLITDNATIIVGLSGGPDSVFLLHVMAELRHYHSKNLKIIAAHLNHEWRPEADIDAQLCQTICDTLKIALIIKKMSELGLQIKFNGSKEEIGRKARRFFFESLAKEYNADAIALAHHADDQMETFFIRLIRGASLSGLTGMKAKDGLYIRPLISIKKSEILEYLNQHKILYAIDASNESADFLRNRIRNSVIPALKQCDDRFETNFASTHGQLQQTEEFLKELAAKTLKDISTDNAINTVQLLALHPIMRTRVLILWLISAKVPFIPSQGFFDEIVRFLEKSDSREHNFYGKWDLCKKHNKASIKTI